MGYRRRRPVRRRRRRAARLQRELNVVIDASESSDVDEGAPFFDYIAEIALDCDNDGFYDFTRSRNAANDPLDMVFDLSLQDQANCGLQGGGVLNTVVVRARDALGAANTDSATVQIYGRDPVALAESNAGQAGCGQAVTFTCANSTHENRRDNPAIVACRWDFDSDGVVDAAGDLATDIDFAFDGFGDFTVTLQVVDADGRTAEDTLEVIVQDGNNPPTAALVGPVDARAGQGITLDASGSTDGDPGCGDSITYNISFVDKDGNNVSIDSLEDQIELTPAQVDSLLANPTDPDNLQPVALVTLTVTDSFGQTAEDQAQIRVFGDGPIADLSASAQQVGCAAEFNLDASGSEHGDPNGQLANFSFDLDGDGNYETDNGANPVLAASITERGDSIFGVRVTDGDGKSDTAATTVTMTFQNQAPLADAGPDYDTAVINGNPLPIDLDASGSRDPNEPCDSIVTFAWDLDDDGQFDDADGAIIAGYTNAAWQPGAVQIINVQVTDADGLSSVDQALIRVQDEPPPDVALVAPVAGARACGPGNEVVFDVSDPEGDVVTVTASVGAQQIGTVDIDTPDDGSDARASIVWDASGFANGDYVITVEAADPKGGVDEVTSDDFAVENADGDADGVFDCLDNCPADANTNQDDTDGDGEGDVCDADTDGDGVDNNVDNCLLDANFDQADNDADGLGDVCDDCDDDPDNDVDGDGICGDVDNCRNTFNPAQTDDNADGFGDACVDPNVEIDEGVDLGEGVVVEAGAEIGQNAQIGDNAVIQHNANVMVDANINAGANIGEGAVIAPHVDVGQDAAVGDNVVIGDRANVGENVIIGNDANVGSAVVIGDNSEIGAGSDIEFSAQVGADADIGADVFVGASVVGDGVDVGDNAWVGNNNDIGDDCVIEAGAAIWDRVTLGPRCFVGANRIIENDVFTGADVSIGAVTNNALTIGVGTRIGDGTSLGVDAYTYGGLADIGMRNAIGNGVIVGGFWFGLQSTYGHDNIVGDNAQLWVGQSMGNNNQVGANTQLQTSCATGNGNVFGPGIAIGPNAVFGDGNTVNISLPGAADYGSNNVY